MKQKQSEMTLRTCFGKHASQTVDFYCFKLFYAFLNDFETFYPFNVFLPLLGFLLLRFFVTSLLCLVTFAGARFYIVYCLVKRCIVGFRFRGSLFCADFVGLYWTFLAVGHSKHSRCNGSYIPRIVS